MTRIDVEVKCPYCEGKDAEHPEGRTFKRMIAISMDLDLSVPRKLKSENVCAFCKKKLQVNVKVRIKNPCCDKPLVKGHFDLIPIRRQPDRLLHRICANCGKQIAILENVEVIE